LNNANTSDILTFNSHNSQKVLNENFIIVFWKTLELSYKDPIKNKEFYFFFKLM